MSHLNIITITPSIFSTNIKNNKTMHGWYNITISSNPKFYIGYSSLLKTTKNINHHISIHNTTITCRYGAYTSYCTTTHTTRTTTTITTRVTTITTTLTTTITSNNNTTITSTNTTMTMNTTKTITTSKTTPLQLLPGLYNYQYY